MNLSEINRKWREHPMERSRALMELQNQLNEKRAQIDRLRAEIQAAEDAFEDDWRQRKDALYTERNESIKRAAREGKSGAEILKEMGSSNTQLVYKLVAEANAHPEEGDEGEVHEDSVLEGVEWQAHPHTGVHRWLLSVDGLYYKRYAPDATPEDPEWYVAMTGTNIFVAGSRDLYDRTPLDEVDRRVGMLKELLAGTYAGKIRAVPPPFVA